MHSNDVVVRGEFASKWRACVGNHAFSKYHTLMHVHTPMHVCTCTGVLTHARMHTFTTVNLCTCTRPLHLYCHGSLLVWIAHVAPPLFCFLALAEYGGLLRAASKQIILGFWDAWVCACAYVPACPRVRAQRAANMPRDVSLVWDSQFGVGYKAAPPRGVHLQLFCKTHLHYNHFHSCSPEGVA